MVFIAVILDFATGKVSNKLILAGLLLSFISTLVKGNISSILLYLFSITVPIILLLFIFMIGGIGAGDVKLFAVIGGFIGYQGVLWCIVFAFIFGAILSVGKILIQKRFFLTLRNLGLYIFQIVQSKHIQVYKQEKSNTIHFTLPILISVLCYIGGIL